MVVRRSLTRRQALEAGALAAAAVSLRPAVPALAARRSRVRARPRRRAGATAASAGWRTTRVLRAPRRFDLMGLVWARGSHAEAQLRARRRGGRWTRWVDAARARRPRARPRAAARRHRPGVHRRRRRVPAPPARRPARAARPLRARAAGRARWPRGSRRARRAQAGAPPAIIPRSAWGGDSVPPREPPIYGEVQLAFVHHTVTANDYTPEESAGIVLSIARYHRNSQRLERHRLPVPRRQVRPDLRGPRGRDRPGRGRRAGAGLEQHLDGHRLPRRLQLGRPDARGHGRARAADRLEAVGPRRARPPARSP